MCVERAEAEAILDGDRETAIGPLLRLDELVKANQRLVEANERLEARVGELERRLSRSSRNSSLPPSQDPPSAPPQPRGQGSGRKRGGQPGHEGRYRRLLAPELVDEIVEHWPDRCGSCARKFRAGELVDAWEPSRRQLAELPPTAVRVSEHRLHWVCCPACAAVTTAPPPAASRWSFGPRLQAAIVLTTQTALFRIAAGRHASEAQTMLGERYPGIVCSDRYPGYDYLDPTRRQLCWAHLLRDVTAHSEGMGEQASSPPPRAPTGAAAGTACPDRASTSHGSAAARAAAGPGSRPRGATPRR